MWQHHYVIHMMKMDQLHAEAEQERRWRLDDLDRLRHFAPPAPGAIRAWAARAVAAISRATARVARRLDQRVAVDLGADRLLRDA